jgi:hypothetical protein
MIRWQLELMWPLLVTLLLLSAFMLYVYTHSAKLYLLKVALIPALMGVMAFSFPYLASRMGYGYPEGLPESFEYVAHKLVIEEQRKAWIDVMVVSRKPLERDARLHRMPWSDALEKALKKAQQMQQHGGGEVRMERGQGDEYPNWMPRRVMPSEVMPKDGLRPAPGRPTMPPSAPPPDAADMLQPKGPTI